MSQESSNKRIALPKGVQLSIFRRDRWLCRWCNKPVIFAPVMKYFELELRNGGHPAPVAYYHPHWTRATAPLLDELGAVLDHIAAHTRGGPCTPENLVTSCAKCNGRKSAAAIEKWALRDIRRPIKGKYGEPEVWDGLSNLFVLLADRHAVALTSGERAWLKAIKAA